MELYQFLARGGIIMIPILALSVLALTVFLERLWAVQRKRVSPVGVAKAIVQLVQQSKFSEAEALGTQSDTAVGRIGVAGLRYRGRTRALIREAMEDAGAVEIGHLERFTSAIATVATVAPLLGLLGTVTGMIKVFRDVAQTPDPEISALAGGIWEALITTAAGLCVAIPAYAMYRFVMSRIDRMARELSEQTLEMLDAIDRMGHTDADPKSRAAA